MWCNWVGTGFGFQWWVVVMVANGGEARAQDLTPEEIPSQPAPGAEQELEALVKEVEQIFPTITVTSEFRPEDLQKVPNSITAIPSDVMEMRGLTRIIDTAAQVPNVTLKPGGAGYGPALQAYIRGVGQYDFNFALEPGVGVYVDDVYYPTLSGSILDLLDLERVEVLRGPQGTLAGKNSIGGSIRLVSRKPGDDEEIYVKGVVGSRQRLDHLASAQYQLRPEVLSLRMSTATRSQEGYIQRLDYSCDHADAGLPTYVTGDGCVLGTEGGQNYMALRSALRWQPGDRLEVNLVGDFSHDRSEVQASTLVAARVDEVSGYGPQYIPADPYVSYSTFSNPSSSTGPYSLDPVNGLTSWGTAATIDVGLGEGSSLRSITAYRAYDSSFSSDNDGSPIHRELVMNYLWHEQLSQEVRISGVTPNGDLEYTTGVFFLSQHNLNRNRVDLGYAGLDFLSDDPVDATNYSAFLHGTWHSPWRMNLTAGSRYTAESKCYTFSRLNPDGTPHDILGSLNGVEGEYQGTHPDFRLVVDYNPSQRWMAYAQYSTGFKGGGINPRPFAATQVQPFRPETLAAVEMGLKGTFWRDRVRTNLATFVNQYDDIVLTLLSCDEFSPAPGFPCAMPSNAGDALVRGVELEWMVRPLSALSLDGAVSVLDFDYLTIDPRAQTSSGGGIQPGMITPFTPRVKGSGGIQWQMVSGGPGTLTSRLDVSYQGEMYTNAVNADTNLIKAYYLANVHLQWLLPDARWPAGLEVTNLMDTLYYYQIFDLLNLAGFSSAQPAPGREWAVSLSHNF